MIRLEVLPWREAIESMTPPAHFSLSGRRVFVAGDRGMVGSALIRRLAQEECRILTAGRDSVDLRDQPTVDRWFDEHRPEAVLLAAARVGGIHANDIHPGDFLYDNLMIATNVIEASRRTGVEKLLFLGSSCIYPRLAPQPMPEDCLLTGPLEPTNEWYAIAKIAGLAQLIADIVGFKGTFVFDSSKPDGTPRKLLDISKLTALGWRPRINFEAGILQTYQWYRTSRTSTS